MTAENSQITFYCIFDQRHATIKEFQTVFKNIKTAHWGLTLTPTNLPNVNLWLVGEYTQSLPLATFCWVEFYI